ncbi:hypothetical protein N7492_003895 [Penicillium capsulatum]|uniref:Uncharacterized protein n=1 Tax=Penicillium capsulatum TaxID=69766 RepID=A0A9W9LX00_9EURO|nr:hypothetical protein N7492_003895 [Penicillium capsulatum]KAJ6121525.1 hypothetical protein N7512_003990 [Penicillium capsulatum]
MLSAVLLPLAFWVITVPAALHGTNVTGWAINEKLAGIGQIAFTTSLYFDTHAKITDQDVAFLAQTAYDDLNEIMKNYNQKDYGAFDKPAHVALVAKGKAFYLASTIRRRVGYGAWNPPKTNDAVRTALYQCQARIISESQVKQPANCAEAMAMHLYYSANPDKKDDSLGKDVTLVVYGQGDGDKNPRVLKPCQAKPAKPESTDISGWASAIGCQNLVDKMGVKVYEGKVDMDSDRGKHLMGILRQRKVCV